MTNLRCMDKEREGRSILNSIFPPKYDFQGMLQAQASKTLEGVNALVNWLEAGDLSIPPDELIRIEQQADDMRHHMEDQLIEAFSTPFDRQDIYLIARQMDYILNFSLSTAIEIRAFGFKPDEPVVRMALALQEGTLQVVKAIKIMEKEPILAGNMIKDIREAERRIDDIYVNSIASAFQNDEPICVMKKREIYHHLRDAGRTLSVTIDALHRVIVGIA